MTDKLSIKNVTVSKGRMCEVTFSSTFDYLFDDNTFWANYNRDLNDVPESILAIPALATLAPVAWAQGADIHVHELDRTFYYALHAIQAAWREVPVDYEPTGTIHAQTLVENDQPTEAGESALLFSGGVDSLHSYVRHRDEQPLLMTTRGADVLLENQAGWDQVERDVSDFADGHGLQYAPIASNLKEMIDVQLVDKMFRTESVRPWWGRRQFGLGLLGLCAPLTITDDIGSVYLSSSTPDYVLEPPAHPTIIEQVEWANTSGVLVAPDVHRQDKIEEIVEYTEIKNDPLYIRSCHKSAAGDNCGECGKCARTLVGLLVAGADPREYGYDVDRTVFPYIRRQFENNAWTIKEMDVGYWEDIQNHIELREEYPIDGARDFLEWLEAVDIRRFEGLHRGYGSSLSKGDFIPDSLYPYAYRARKRYRSLQD